jgi:hypothetical protein
MRVGVDRNKYQIHIPLPPKIDPTVTMMQVSSSWTYSGCINLLAQISCIKIICYCFGTVFTIIFHLYLEVWISIITSNLILLLWTLTSPLTSVIQQLTFCQVFIMVFLYTRLKSLSCSTY